MPHATSPTISRLCHAAPDCPEGHRRAAHELQKPKVGSPRSRDFCILCCILCLHLISGPWDDLSEAVDGKGRRPPLSRAVLFGSVLFGSVLFGLHPPQVLFFPSHSVGETPKTSTDFSPATHQS